MGAMESKELDDIADQIGESLGVEKEKKGLELLAEWIELQQAKRILVLTGAGVSTGTTIVKYTRVPV